MLIKSITKTEKLTKRVESYYEERQFNEEQEKKRQERTKTIKKAQRWIYTDFYCHICKQDILKCAAYKVVQTDWVYPHQQIAYYEAFKACHKGLRRYITDKNQDPYYRQSKMIEQQRREAIAKGDLLQPDDYGFKTKYGDINKKKWQQMDKQERQDYECNNQ